MTRARKLSRVPRLWSAGVALGAFFLYLFLCPPVSGDKDSAEFTVVLALAGVAHPTGYPLFTLLGHAWVTVVHALGGTWAFAANTWSALGGAVAIYFLQRLALALIGPRALARRSLFGLSVLAAFALCLNPIWTNETTLAEVNAWHVAWALGAATLFVGLMRMDRPSVGHAALWGFVCGLGAAHHATSVFVIVPLSGVLLARFVRTPSARHVVAAVGAMLVPLASYAYIPWRAAQSGAHAWPLLRPGLDGLLEHATGRQYAANLGRFEPSPVQLGFLTWYVWPFLLPGLLMLILYARRSRELALYGVAGSALLGTIYAFSYGVPDPSSYFLYPMAFGLAGGAAFLSTGIARREGASIVVSRTLYGLFTVLSIAWFGIGAMRSNGMKQLDGIVDAMWRSIPYDKAFVFFNDDMYHKLVERQALGHEKPGIILENAAFFTHPVPLARFVETYGFDPVPPGAPIKPPPQVVEHWVNAASPLPVVDFDLEHRSVRVLKKPMADSSAAPK